MTCDPNRPGGTSGYDPNDFRHWNSRCDLDQDYDVDLADLVIFADDLPKNWLWVACWRLDLQPGQLNMTMNPSMPTMGLQAASLDTATVSALLVETPQKPIREQILELKDTIQFLERLWLEDESIQQEIDAGEWRQFMENVYQNMTELQNVEINPINLKEVNQ